MKTALNVHGATNIKGGHKDQEATVYVKYMLSYSMHAISSAKCLQRLMINASD